MFKFALGVTVGVGIAPYVEPHFEKFVLMPLLHKLRQL